jgi:hypothetical protein
MKTFKRTIDAIEIEGVSAHISVVSADSSAEFKPFSGKGITHIFYPNKFI